MPGTDTSAIDKYPFSTVGVSTGVGNLVLARATYQGISSTQNGYTVGGYTVPTPIVTCMDKFPFATDSSSTNIGCMSPSVSGASWSSFQNGYNTGGNPSTNIVKKFSFASDSNAITVGNAQRCFASNRGHQD
jgi:hypothetical protein